MITADQPTIFPSTVLAAVSSPANGDMKFGLLDDEQVVKNREKFLQAAAIPLERSVLMKISYDRENFTQYSVVGPAEAGSGMHTPAAPVADALVTTEANVGLFLPLADCVGVILHAPQKHVLMVSHVGRHSLEQHGAVKSIQCLQAQFGATAADILAWLSPAAGKEKYPLHAFGGRSMHEVVREQLLSVGVPAENIQSSPIDTTKNAEYFSHSEYLKGNQADDGRFAIAAMMLEQGEPA